MNDHYYLDSGWCICGHHRDDGTRDRPDPSTIPTRDEIRSILGPTYEPRNNT